MWQVRVPWLLGLMTEKGSFFSVPVDHFGTRKCWDCQDVAWSRDDRTFTLWLASRHSFQLGLGV